MEFDLFSLASRPDLEDRIDELSPLAWPEFLLHSDVRGWGALFNTFQSYQLLFCDKADGALLAVGHTVPLVWDGTLPDLPPTITDIISRGLAARENGYRPNTVSALAAMVYPEHRGRGLSTEIIRQMTALAARTGCTALIAPVRPSLKSDYPLIPMEDYMRWTRPDGQAFDPWLRVHLRLGGEILAVAENSLAVDAPIADWEAWTGLTFPGSGNYVVPGALQPVAVDRRLDRGRYEEPNVWIKHSVAEM